MTDPAQAIGRALDAHRAELRRRHGACLVEVDAEVDAEGRRVRLSGRLLARRFAPRIAAVVAEALGPGWTIDASGLQGTAGEPWRHLVDPITPLWAAIPSRERRAALATELTGDDGPVRPLLRQESWTLVVATDATMGWTDVPLGPESGTPAPPRWSGAPPDAFVTAVRGWLDVPYRLGGTTRPGGIDCSGLVQRALRQSHGGLVPRHTSDQLMVGPRDGPGPDAPGTWIFVWSSAEAPGHIGVADGGGRVVHASRIRGVVDDSRDDFLAGCGLVRHVAWTAIENLQARLSGHCSLDEVFELGRRP